MSDPNPVIKRFAKEFLPWRTEFTTTLADLQRAEVPPDPAKYNLTDTSVTIYHMMPPDLRLKKLALDHGWKVLENVASQIITCVPPGGRSGDPTAP